VADNVELAMVGIPCWSWAVPDLTMGGVPSQRRRLWTGLWFPPKRSFCLALAIFSS